MIPSTTATRPPLGEATRARPGAHLRAAGRDQAVVAGGQVVAGLGNLGFVAAAARFLPAGGFGHLAAFVALLTALNLPGAGLAAAGSLTPDRAADLARRCAAAGTLAGATLAILALPAAALTGLPVSMVLALAVATPAAPLLGLRRGIAYGTRDHRSIVLSLLAEPAARLVIGLSLGLAAGATGAAWGAAAGGWLALASLRRGAPAGNGRATDATATAAATAIAGAVVHDDPAAVLEDGGLERVPATGARTTGARAAGATGVAFVALALLQHQDLVLANRLLGAPDAGAFAALSTIGGLVAFATATLPLVLLPRSARDEAGGLPVALGAALAIALAAVGLAGVAARPIVLAVVGARYTPVAPLVPPYLAAMGALGVARVLAAHWCAQGQGRRVARFVVGVAVAHASALLLFARSPGAVVAVSGLALVTTAGVLALPTVWERPRHRLRWQARLALVARRPDARLLAVLTVLAVLLRLATERSLWVDEAISLRQARLPLGDMLDDLRHTDVHPPLHFVVLWVTVRLLGTAEWAVRLPSVLFGAALVPALHGMARELFDRRTAQVAAALAVPAPFLVWYSQEARMYALFMLIGVLAVWAQVAALRRGSAAAFAAWGVASAALVWTQWFALLPLLVQQAITAAVLWRRRRDRAGGDAAPAGPLLARWVGSLALTIVLVLPLVPFVQDQLAAYGQRGAGLTMPAAAGADSSDVASGLSSYAVIANLLWAVGGYHSDDVMVRLGALWPLALLACLLLLGRRLQWTTGLLLCVALVPGALLFVVGHTKRDLFELRYFVLAAPLLLVVVARAVTTLARTRASLAGATAALLAVSSLALVDQQVNGTNPRLYDFRGAVAEIEETAQPGDVLAYAPAYLDGVLAYYAPEMPGTPLGAIRPETVDGQIYVVVAERFLTGDTAGRIGDVLAGLEQARGRPDRFERPNVIVWRFR